MQAFRQLRQMGGMTETVYAPAKKNLRAFTHCGRRLDPGEELIHDAERGMEILVFAVIASYNARRKHAPVVAEPEEFQPFDLEAL